MRFIAVACALSLGVSMHIVSYSSPAQAQIAEPTLAEPTAAQSATLLKPGDRIRITVIGFPELSGEQLVAADGTIQLPLAGAIDVGRLIPTQAVARISEALLPYVRRPQVSLVVLSLSSLRVTVTGEVVQPGPRLLSPYASDSVEETAPIRPVTLSSALLQAGGITPNADIQNVIIRRIDSTRSGVGTSEEPAKTEIRVDLWQSIRGGDLAADPRIQDGDEIIIPTAGSNGIDQRALLSSTVAPTQITVQVAGEVVSPGSIELAPSADLSAAVAAAGGPTDDADANRIALLRVAPDGRLQQQIYEFGENSLPLRDGDVIVVDKRSEREALNVLNLLLNPLGFLFDLF
ncbi:SLBB domain-containing protein [Microcoleus sp. FACHB-1515]|uniref:polysaccharide biosynthesis/export family protein n=1 Tax=Cyanophyceae TaxID=3028117 RepID=UPI0016827B27|nr:polysaccharide biosynthesis/export family protein [Microcoleus sp. FACHB-1515]MBD2089095.1 SLBB domain-containing protein [Microcoleus sp. FACHB-1515]